METVVAAGEVCLASYGLNLVTGGGRALIEADFILPAFAANLKNEDRSSTLRGDGSHSPHAAELLRVPGILQRFERRPRADVRRSALHRFCVWCACLQTGSSSRHLTPEPLVLGP